jgi:hypothetical protein
MSVLTNTKPRQQLGVGGSTALPESRATANAMALDRRALLVAFAFARREG